MKIEGTTSESFAPARLRIARLVITAVLITVAIGGTGAGALLAQQYRMRWLSERWQPAYVANTNLIAAVDRADVAVQNLQRSPRASDLTSYQRARAALITDLAAVDSADVTLGLGQAATAQHQAITSWLDDYADPVVAGRADQLPAEAARVAAERLNTFRADNTEVGSVLDAKRERALRVSTLTTIMAIMGGAVTTLIAGLILVRRGLRTQRELAPPLEQLHEVVRARRAGDQQIRADTREGVPEIRAVAAELNDLIEMSDRQRGRLLETLRLTEAVRDLALIAGRELDLDAVLKNTVEPLARMFRVDAASIRAFDGEGELPGRGTRATYPDRPGPFPTGRLMELSHRAARQSWLHQRCVIISADEVSGRVRDQSSLVDDKDAAEIFAFVGQLGASSMMIIGMGSGVDCLGYLVLGRFPGQPVFSTAEAAAALRTGHELGQAIMHARLFEREEALLRQVQELDAAKTDFVTSVSHELRTPLTSIVGNLELLRDGDVGPIPVPVARRLDSMERNTARLTALIEDLLLLARVEDRQVEGVVDADLPTLLADVVDSCRPSAMARKVAVDVRVEHRARAVICESEVKRALSNVVDNAIKFSPAGSSVTITLGCTDDVVCLSIADQGIGISRMDQRSLFGKFFRSTDPAVQAQPGTGLGLAVAKLIMDRHHGSIELRSELGRGTTVMIKLPRRAASRLLPADDHSPAALWSAPLADTLS